jgi:peptide chain release factor 2
LWGGFDSSSGLIDHESGEENTSASPHSDQRFRLLFAQLGRRADDLQALMELASTGGDLLLEWSANLKRLEGMLSCLDRMIRTRDHFDARDAYVQLVPTRPSTAAFLWVERLTGVLTNWARKMGLRSAIFHQHPAPGGGIEEITLRMEGPVAFGLLRPEMGLHCWRTAKRSGSSPAQRMRTVRVTVSPILTATELALDDSELRWESFRTPGQSGHS